MRRAWYPGDEDAVRDHLFPLFGAVGIIGLFVAYPPL